MHKKSVICSSGHKLVIIRAYYEHLYPPCALLMLQVCLDNAHLWTSSDLLKVPSFSSLFCHDARILHSFLRHHRASSVHHSIIFIQLMLHLNCCYSDGALMATLHNFTFFVVKFFFNWVPSIYLLFHSVESLANHSC